MIEQILEKLIQLVYRPMLGNVEQAIGYKLVFRNIPERYINGWVACSMTSTWKNFGLDIEKGGNYFTMGHVVNGISSRFTRTAPEYQSWLGGYTVKMAHGSPWTPEDHFKLAIADQNNWLRKWYNDPSPQTTIEDWEFKLVETIQIGQHSGRMYEFGCTTQSDIGNGRKTLHMYLASIFMTAMFKTSRPGLQLKAAAFRPAACSSPYETLKLPGYIAVFDVEKNVKVVLYANGAVVKTGNIETDTFLVLKDDLRHALESCDIVKT